MICAIVSFMFSLMIGCVGLMLQLALWILQAFVMVTLELSTIVVELILSIIGSCFGATGGAVSNRKALEPKSTIKYIPDKDTHKSLSRRERKAIEKNVRREIKKARDDLEYDMLMMMEVCADD